MLVRDVTSHVLFTLIKIIKHYQMQRKCIKHVFAKLAKDLLIMLLKVIFVGGFSQNVLLYFFVWVEIAFNCLSVERNVLACSCSATSPPSLTDPVLSTTRPTPPRQTTSKDTAGRGWRRWRMQAPLCLPRPVRLHASTGRGWVRNRYVTHWPSDEHVFSEVRQNATSVVEKRIFQNHVLKKL